jgi:pimeloyl-ACP methyl ester carboxylesterase
MSGAWLLVLGVVLGSSAKASVADELKRRGFLGAALGPVSEKIQKEQKLPTSEGAVVLSVIPDSSAEAGGVMEGDVLVAVDGTPITNPATAIAAVSARKGGDVFKLHVVRNDGEKHVLEIKLKERPREESETFDVVYGSLVSKAGRLRTIVTRPKSSGKHPALLFIQGIGCYSVEGLTATRPAEFQLIANEFTRHGFVTLRVEKPGCGDSEGGPCEDVDFETELDGYRQALKQLKGLDGVDPANVFIFGHSLGGLWAPVVASEEPVKGVAVYGTVLKPWYEYELENRRRQLLLSETPYPAIDADMRAFTSVLHALYFDKKSIEEIGKDHPELREMARSMSPDGSHMYGRSLTFMRQIAALRMSDYWDKLDAHVLAAWGKAEYVSTESDHRQLADLINARHPGHGTFLALEGMDHGFHRASSAKDRFKDARAGVQSEFNPLITQTLLGWAEMLAKAS